ncbi:hypothetical protein [Nocardia aurantiaca]|nr:hypothetical protein [Nocardia aurantiaca]
MRQRSATSVETGTALASTIHETPWLHGGVVRSPARGNLALVWH